ncbi:MAG: hypothetical protein R2769_04315 [Saprospiraceae bacterium]
MPDIDIDFDDEGRDKVINYVVEKYGKNQVAQIVTYGTMAAKSSLRDVGRVMGVPLPEVDEGCKNLPSSIGSNFETGACRWRHPSKVEREAECRGHGKG